jgi:hypothetical protein
MAKQRGNPVYTVRLTRQEIAGLKMLADRQGLSTSDILRGLLRDELKRNGISTQEEPIEGQVRL